MSTRKRGLGRGLDALLAPAPDPAPSPASGPAAPRELELDRLRPNRHQPRARFDEEALAELAASIRAQGVLQPLIVTTLEDGGFELIAGERRWRAARLAGLEKVPVVLREAAGERERLEMALVENLQRADLDALEEAEAFRMLATEHGLSHEEIARRVGRSRSAVSNTLRLLQFPVAVRELLRDGRLTAGQARPLLALEGEAQLRLARRAAAEGLSARAIEALVGRQTAGGGRRKRAAPPPEVHAQAAAERLTRELQTRVEIRRRGKGGEIRIRFHGEEELIRLYDRIVG